MVSYVTVQGSTQQPIIIGFDSKTSFTIAEEIAKRINAGIAAGSIITEYDTAGSPPTLPASINGAIVQTRSGLAVLPHGYTTDLITKAGQAVVLGSGADDETILSDVKTDLTFLASSGSGTVVAGGSDSRLSVGGSGNWSLYTAKGNNVIAALGAVNATIGAGRGDNAILLGRGNDLVTSTGKDTIVGGSGFATVDATNARQDLVEGNDSNLVFIGGSGGATIYGQSGSDTYFGSVGPTHAQVIVGGIEGNNYLFAGDGAATLVGGGDGDQLFAYGSHDQLLIAGLGNESLSAAFSVGDDKLQAGSGTDLLVGGGGSDTFVGGSGTATVTAGSGGQVFEFMKGAAGGTELVQGVFDPASIMIHLKGYGSGEIDQALAGQTVTNNSVTIGLTDGTKVTFQDVTSLSKSNFI